MPVLRTQRPDAYNYAGIRVMPCHDCSEELKASARTTTENLKGAVKEIRGRGIRPSRNRGRRTAPNVDDTLPNRYALLDKRAAHPPVSSRSVVNCLPDNLVDGSSTRALSSPVESSASPNACWPPVAFSVCPSILHVVQNTRSRSPDARRLLRRDVSPAYSPPRLDTSKIRVRLTPPMRPPVVPSESAWTNGLTRDKSSAERLVSPVHWEPGMQEPPMPEDVRELPQAPEPMVAPQLTSLEDQSVYYTRRPQAVERRIQIAMERSSPERPEAGLGSPMCQDKASDAWEVQFRQRPPSVDLRIRNSADGPGDSIGALGVPPPDLRRVSDMRTKKHLTRRPEGVERRIAKVDAENDFISGLCARHELPVEAREDCIVETPVMEEKESRSTMLAYLRRPPDVDKRIDRVECENIPEKDSALRLQDDVRAFDNSSVGVAAPHSQHQYVKSTLYPVDRFSHSFPSGAALDASRNVPDVALDHKQLTSASVLEKVFEPNNTIPSHRPVERSHKGLSTLQSAWPSTAWGVLEAEPAVKYNAMPPVKMTDAPSPPHRQSRTAYAPPGGWRATIQEKESTEHLMRPMSDAIDALSQLPRMHGESSSSKRFGQTNAAFPKQTDTIQVDSPNMLDNLINERSFDAPPPPPTAPIATIPQPSSPCVQQASTCSFPVPCCAATPSLSSHHTECKVEDLSSDFALGRAFPWKDDRISTKRSASQPSLPLDIGVKISSSNVSDHPNYRLSKAPQPPPQHEPLTSSTAAKSVNGVLQCSTGVPPRAPELTRDGLYSPSLTVRDRVLLDASNEASDVQVHADSPVIPPVRDQEQPQRRDPHSLLRASLSGNDDGIPGTARKGDADIPRVAEEPPLCLSAEDAVGPKSVARSPPLGDQPHQSSATVANTSNTHNTLQFRRFHILELSGAEVNRDHSGSVAQYTHLDRSTVVAGSYVGTDRRTVACIIERSPQPFPDFHGDPETTFPVLRSRSAPPLLGTFPHTSSPVLPLGYVPTRNQGHPVAPERSGTCTTDVLPRSTSQQPLNFSALEKGSEHASSPRFLLERRVLTPSSSAGDMSGLQPSSPSSILAPILPSFENLPARCSTPVREEVELTQQSNNLDSLPFVPSSPIIPPSIREGTVLMPPSSTLRSIDETSPKRGERISHKKASPDRPGYVEEPSGRSLSPPPRGDEMSHIKTARAISRCVGEFIKHSIPDAYVESIHSRGAETNKTEIVLTNARHGEESTEHFFSDPLRDDEMNKKTSGCVDAQYAEKPTERSVAPPQWRDEMSKQIPASANARHVEEPTEHFLSPRRGGDDINKIVSASVQPRYAKEPIEWSLRPLNRGDEMNTLKRSPSDALYAKEPIERSVSPPQGSDKMSKQIPASANARRVEEPSEHSLSPRRGGDEINKIVSASVHPRYAKEPIEWSLRPPHRGDEMNTLKQSPSDALYAKEPIERPVSPPQGSDKMSKLVFASANARRVEEPSEHSLSPRRGGDEINKIVSASVHPRYAKEPIEWSLRPPHRGDEMNTLKQSPSNALYAEELAERSVSPPQGRDEMSKQIPASANARRVEEPSEHALSTPRGGDEINNIFFASVHPRYTKEPIEWALRPSHRGDEMNTLKQSPSNALYAEELAERSVSPPQKSDDLSKLVFASANAQRVEEPTEHAFSTLRGRAESNHVYNTHANFRLAAESTKHSVSAPPLDDEMNNALYQSVDSRYAEKPIEWSLSPALWGHERDKIRTSSAHRQRKDESVECSLSPPPLRGEFSETKTTPSGAPHCAPYTEQNISLLSKSGQMGRISTAPNRTLEAEESIERHAFAPATKGEVKTMPASFATPLQLDEFLAFRNTISSDGSDVKRVRTRWTALESLSTRSSMEKDDFNTLFKKIDNAPVNTSGTLNSGMPTSSIATDRAPQMDLSATIHATWTEEDAMVLTAKPLRHNTCKESRKPMKDDRVDRCAVDGDDVAPLPSQGVPYPTLTCLSDFPYDNSLSSSPHVVEDASPLNETGCVFRRASDRRERVTRLTEEGINAYPGPLSLAPPLSFSPPRLASERSASRSIMSELARPGFTDDSLPTFVDYSQYDARRAVNPPRLGIGGTHPVSPLPARAVQRRGEDDSTALSTTFETSDPKSGVSLTVSADKCADSVLQITEPSVFVTSGCGDVASAASSGEYDANTCEVLHEFDQPQNASVVGINHPMWSENDVHPTELVTLDADIPQDTLDDQATFLEAAIQGEREVRVRTLSPVMSNSRESSVIRSTDMADIDGALRSDDPANDSNEDISCCAPPAKQGEPADTIEDIVSPECASAQVLTTDVGAEKAMERCCDKVGDLYAQLAERSFPETVANAESDPKLPGQRELSQPPSVASEGSPLQRNILSTVSPPFPKRSVSPPALQTHAPRRSVRLVVDRRLVLHARYTSITAKQPMSSRSQSFLSNCTTPMARTPQMPFFPTRFFSQPNSQPTSQTSVVTTSGKNSTASFSAVSAVDNTRCGATKVPPVSAVAQVTTHASTCDKSLIQLASAANSKRSRIILTAPSSGFMPLHAYGRDSVASEARRTTIRGNSWVHPAKPGHNACQNITNPLPFAPVAKTANIKLQPVPHL